MATKKHRYFVVDSSEAKVMSNVRARVLARSGEFGLGRMAPQVRFVDRRGVMVIRVSRESAALFAEVAGLPILRVAGSMRTCRPHVVRELRRRYEGSEDSESLRESLAHLHRIRN